MAVQDMDERSQMALAEQSGGTVSEDNTETTEVVTETEDTSTEENLGPDTLEFNPGEPDTETKEEGTEEVSDPEDSTEQNKSVDTRLKEAGFDLDKIAKEFQDTGDISAEMIADIKTKIDPDLVDAHLQRIRVEFELAKYKAKSKGDEEATKKVVAMNDYIYNSVGGEDNFNVMAKLLHSKASKEEQESINAKLASGNKVLVAEGMKVAVEAYNKIKGMGGKLMSGDAGTVQTEEAMPRVTKEDFRAIMKSEKYKTDKAYRIKMDTARMATAKADKASYRPGQYFGFTNGQRYEL